MLRADGKTAAMPSLSSEQFELGVGYGLVTHERAGLLTTYGGMSVAGPQSHGVHMGGRTELGERVELSVEGARTTQSDGAEHLVALY